MRATITVQMDNEAFGETLEARAFELGQILRDLGADLQNGYKLMGSNVRDVNGNIVGEFKLEGE